MTEDIGVVRRVADAIRNAGNVQHVIVAKDDLAEVVRLSQAPAAELARPIVGIENRTAQEVFDIMVDRIRYAGHILESQASAAEANTAGPRSLRNGRDASSEAPSVIPATGARELDELVTLLEKAAPYVPIQTKVRSDIDEALLAIYADRRAALSTLSPASVGAGEPVAWQSMETAPLDGTEVLLFHEHHGIIQGRFAPGEWSEDTPISPAEYSGAVWVLGDDLEQVEVEELPIDAPLGMTHHHGAIINWRPLYASPATPTEQAEQGGAEKIMSAVKDALRGEPGDEYTDRGMEDAFFRWPVIERAILAALREPAPEGGGHD